MSSRATKELKVLSPDEINNIRVELYSKAAANRLDKDTIDRILARPPSRLIGVLHELVTVLGPLSSFSGLDYPSQPDPVLRDGDALLDDALTALNDYNKLIEEKLAKFSLQTARSLAAIDESTAEDQNLALLSERIADTKQQRLKHAQQIDMLRRSLKSCDETQLQKLEEYHTPFWSEALFLNFHGISFDRDHQFGSGASERGIWDEHDAVLEHVQRWRQLVNVNSPGGQQITDGAQEHVNQLVMSITHQCQVQLAAVFYESQAENTAQSAYRKAVQDEAADIAKEIDWLWEEVIPVAHMSVSAQFLKPVLNRFQNWETSKKFREAVVTTYASGVLRFMNDRLNAVAERTRILVYHHQALYNAAWIRQSKETSSSEDVAPQEIPRTTTRQSQSERQYRAASESLHAFMQIHGGVLINAGQQFTAPTPSLLNEHVQSRVEKGDNLLKDLHKLFEATIKSGLTERELSGDLLLESLLTDSSANPTQPGSIYKDVELEKSIELLQNQTNHIQEMFKRLKLDGPSLAPDYVAHVCQQTTDRLAGKTDEKGLGGCENQSPTCSACMRCLKFEEFVRKWAC
ncbi:hypothetical protein F4861DRAFT_528601 [Xylaria intraflava]|nr:hypothetical protein F4861DRAFT_528601 [Xylaria intraflava]